MSTNRHRSRIDEEQLRAILAMAGINPSHLVHWGELGSATFNTAYRIKLTSGDGLVLKVAPDPAAPVLTHEHGIMRTEAAFYRAAAGTAPVPLVVHADFSHTFLPCDLLLMTELPGTAWYDLRSELDPGSHAKLRTELGGVVAALHGVTGSEFGYPQRPPAPTWRVAFTSMVTDLLCDAKHYATPLPRPARDIRDTVAAHSEALDKVTTPVLVHFDLWPGNILLHENRISGLVDGERAFWGDPLADFVSLALFDDLEDDDAFRSGYGPVVLDEAARVRLALYRMYLYLIMLVEGGPRGYSGPERDATVRMIAKHVELALAVLDG